MNTIEMFIKWFAITVSYGKCVVHQEESHGTLINVKYLFTSKQTFSAMLAATF